MSFTGPNREFIRKKHSKYFQRCLQILPGRYASLETSRMTAAFFAISGLDMMNCLDVLDKDKDNIIKWIYSLQVHPNKTDSNLYQCGFRGSPAMKVDNSLLETNPEAGQYDSAHVAMTYTALLSLLILGDDLSGVNPKGVLAGVKHLQRPDGSFCSTPEGSENDMRFVYCASCICSILNDWSGMDQDLTVKYILSSLTYEGAFAQGPGLEAHGGSTFCAVASLVLMSRLHTGLSPKQLDRLRRWCILRQESGFQGRPNKPVDTCYSFWVGATLQLLDIYHMTDALCNRSYLMDTQDPMVGGFAKWPDNTPDPLHAYFGVCGLSLLGEPNLKAMHASLNVSLPAADRLDHLQQRWSIANNSTLEQIAMNFDLDLSSEHSKHVKHKENGSCSENEISEPDQKSMNEVTNGPTKKSLKPSDGCIGPPCDDIGPPLMKKKHVAFFQQCLQGLPAACQSVDASRLTIVCFAVSALDLLDNEELKEKQNIIDWIYSLQINNELQDNSHSLAGFSGSPCVKQTLEDLDTSHLAMTYFALCSLVVLRDDLSRVQRQQIIEGLKHLQTKDGCFCPSTNSTQTDIKFIYWAIAISYILKDWSGVDVPQAVKYIKSCKTYEGGFGQGPGCEAHGGGTFCAVASLWLLGAIHQVLSPEDLASLRRWCLSRQEAGFSSRTSKDQDIPYTFWNVAILQLLDNYKSLNAPAARQFIKSKQAQSTGGFKSNDRQAADHMTSFFGIGALSFLHEPGIHPLHPALSMSHQALQHLSFLHYTWSLP